MEVALFQIWQPPGVVSTLISDSFSVHKHFITFLIILLLLKPVSDLFLLAHQLYLIKVLLILHMLQRRYLGTVAIARPLGLPF